METKQTAVQWLKEKLFELEIKIDYKTHEEAFFIFEQAKQIEKEQIKDSYIDGWNALAKGRHQYSEYYYQKTYGK